jgi:hypothetical protein
MELTKVETLAVEKTLDDVREAQMRELNDLQLALIGGGIGEVIVA